MNKIVEENLDRIFSIQDICDTQVVIKVHADSPLILRTGNLGYLSPA